jgi:hypothetical protein
MNGVRTIRYLHARQLTRFVQAGINHTEITQLARWLTLGKGRALSYSVRFGSYFLVHFRRSAWRRANP